MQHTQLQHLKHKVGDFVFEEYMFNETECRLHMHYYFENSMQQHNLRFEEVIEFPKPAKPLSPQKKTALNSAFRLLFLLAGVSYYKAYACDNLRCDAFPIDKQTADFIHFVYKEGLGEFAFVNNIDFTEFKGFKICEASGQKGLELDLSNRTCVPVGGGKDSIVTIETLKPHVDELVLFRLGNAGPILKTIEQSGLSDIAVTRKIDKRLLDLNQQGAYNGHVPITAILSSIVVACGILQDFNCIAMSVERSASEATRTYLGNSINHQFSKSLAFENAFANYVKDRVSPSIHYFSLLRPLYEIHIMQKFSSLTQYHSVFRSCNAAFKLNEKDRASHWCCDCPKCRFIFLGLAPFLAKQELIDIFGENLLSNPAQQEGFYDLCGLGDGKPFECVGETLESAAAMKHLSTLPEWQDELIVKNTAERLSKESVPALDEFLKANSQHHIPEFLWTKIQESFSENI